MGKPIQVKDVMRAWGRILTGHRPSMSIEITRECPLRCPGCYAYNDQHLGEGAPNLRQLADFKGDELVAKVLALVDRERPVHLSIVGGDPLVRYRELEQLLPKLVGRGIHVQVVTSAFREIPLAWANMKNLNLTISIDGLQPEHDERRKPATYERILKNIAGHKEQFSIHCTVTRQVAGRPGYLEEFVKFWNDREEVKRIWFSFYTPQRGEISNEMLTSALRRQVVGELMAITAKYPKLDMPNAVLREFLKPPQSPEECIFARTTKTYSADLKTSITPCQFGGNPDCSQCGCIASMGLAAVGNKKVLPGVTAGDLFKVSTMFDRG